MLAKWLWLSLPILALALPDVRPQARTEEDCEEPEGPGNYGASPSRNEYNNEYPGAEFSGPYHGTPSAHEVPEYDPSYEFGGPGNGDHEYDPDNRGPWEGGNYDGNENSQPYSNNYNNENSEPYNNYNGNHGEHYNNKGNPEPFFESPEYDPSFEPGPEVPPYESPEYFPNGPPPFPYTSTIGQTITPVGPVIIPTPTPTPTPTSFLLRSQDSTDVPDGTTLSDVAQGDGSGRAFFNNGNGVFALNGNGNLVDVATALVAGIGPTDTDDVLPVQFNVPEQFAVQDGTICTCSTQGDPAILSCDCGQGFRYFQTDATEGLFIGQASTAFDEGYNPVTVLVDDTTEIITCC